MASFNQAYGKKDKIIFKNLVALSLKACVKKQNNIQHQHFVFIHICIHICIVVIPVKTLKLTENDCESHCLRVCVKE